MSGTLSPIQITARRKALGLSQSRFAALLGISVRTLQNWESGHRVPRASTLSLIARALRHIESEGAIDIHT